MTTAFASTGHDNLTARELFDLGPIVVAELHERTTRSGWDGVCSLSEASEVERLTSPEAVVAALESCDGRVDRFVAIRSDDQDAFWQVWAAE